MQSVSSLLQHRAEAWLGRSGLSLIHLTVVPSWWRQETGACHRGVGVIPPEITRHAGCQTIFAPLKFWLHYEQVLRLWIETEVLSTGTPVQSMRLFRTRSRHSPGSETKVGRPRRANVRLRSHTSAERSCNAHDDRTISATV